MSYVAMRDWCVQALGGMPTLSSARAWVAMAASTLATTAALAGPVPDYGHDFVVIGDPGNRPVNQEEGPRFYPPYATEPLSVGSVNYRYRMARTEVTVGQWLDFVNAYARYYDGPTNWSEFTSTWIVYDHGSEQYRALAGTENYAANMGWRYAARYCNWLQNGQSLDQAAFESGAYDTSTFGENPDGSFTDQLHHSPDALFWIPTLDEWTKAMHWDPSKNDGEGGYWRYPTSSDGAPIPGAPGSGETNAGTGEFYDVGAYADAMSPWGLLDGSGGLSELLEDTEQQRLSRYARGSSWSRSVYFDQIDALLTDSVGFSGDGLRLASAVPPPPMSGWGVALICLWIGRPNRKE
ncbi:MAG: SUMF1/EgtB/PvdO family nonheme iron enzyme [Phycisphaerales bacterium]|nr:SUMF1/EgtB/PvdO family nonheme iron enzyme [Phycisphaerales bacterium]